MAGYYLIKQWCPHRGQTSENPSCLFYGGFIYHLPLTEVKSYNCYTSRKRAEKVALKHTNLYSRTEVVEVPKEVLKIYRFDKESCQYVPVETEAKT